MRNRHLGGVALVAAAAVTACSTPVGQTAQPVNETTVAQASSTQLVSPTPTATPTPSVRSTPPPAEITIPKGLLPYEDGEEAREDNRPFVRDCFGRPEASASTRRYLGDPVSGATIEHTLHVYADESAARRAFSSVRGDMPRCFGFPAARLLKEERPPWADEAAAVTVPLPADGAGEHTGAPLRLVTLRVGRALALFYGYPEVPEIDRDAQAVVTRLCRYDGGCAS